MPVLPEVDVIVPTLGAPARGEALARAVRSIAGQGGVRVHVIVVVNGGGSLPGVAGTALDAVPHQVIRLPEAGLPGAYRAGRAAVAAPYFTALDDDDELLPGALALRVRYLEAHADAAVVVTNGLRRSASGDAIHVSDADRVNADPSGRLLEGNWLLPGSWLARTSSVTRTHLEGMPAWLECTWLALTFASLPGFAFLPEPTVVWSVEGTGHASRGVAYAAGQPDALAALLRLPLRADVHRRLRARIPGACQDGAERLLMERRIGEALRLQARAVLQAPPARWPALGRRILSSWWHRGRA